MATVFLTLADIERDNKIGYMNYNGDIVIEPEWKTAGCFSEGLAQVSKKDIEGKTKGFIDKNGELVISGEWSSSKDFHEGLAAVYLAVGEETVEEEYFSTVSGEYETREKIQVISKWGYINTKGEIVIEPVWSFAGNFENGIAVVKDQDDRILYIDTQGVLLYPPESIYFKVQ